MNVLFLPAYCSGNSLFPSSAPTPSLWPPAMGFPLLSTPEAPFCASLAPRLYHRADLCSVLTEMSFGLRSGSASPTFRSRCNHLSRCLGHTGFLSAGKAVCESLISTPSLAQKTHFVLATPSCPCSAESEHCPFFSKTSLGCWLLFDSN